MDTAERADQTWRSSDEACPAKLRLGVITAAFGKRKYIEMAVDLALSVRDKSQLPVSIVTNSEAQAMISARYPGIFERIVSIPEAELTETGSIFVAAKTHAILQTPYDVSIFLDSDMLCMIDPSFLADGVGINDFRIFGRAHTIESAAETRHNGRLIRDVIEELSLQTYTYCSLAAFAFGREAGRRVATLMQVEEAHWKALTASWGDALPDEVLLAILGERSGVSFYSDPSRTYQKQTRDFRWGDEYCFIHSAPMRNSELLRLMSTVVARRKRDHQKLSGAVFWLADVLARNAVQAGRSRRQAAAVQFMIDTIYGK